MLFERTNFIQTFGENKRETVPKIVLPVKIFDLSSQGSKVSFHAPVQNVPNRQVTGSNPGKSYITFYARDF